MIIGGMIALIVLLAGAAFVGGRLFNNQAGQTSGKEGQPCPSSPPAGTLCTIGGIEFVAIPGGEFAMGTSSNVALANEQPVHEVALDAFWMAKTELTFKQWNAFLTATGYPQGRSSAQSDDHPVVSITWEDAQAYCAWFSQTYGRVVRLPSEAEWEYAARGGLRDQQYPNGDSISPREANYASDGPVRVASYPPNGYGLYDMAGNVFEWVGDWYDKDYYRASPHTNPQGPATQENMPQRRADRGGGWCMGIERVRVSARHAGPVPQDEGGTADCLGFRLLMEMNPAP
jgi:formylglycine-generating enzyme required for sulfatase activity